jgi:cytochrome P450
MAMVVQETTETGIPVVAFNPQIGPPKPLGGSMDLYDDLREQFPGMFRSSEGDRGFWVLTSCELVRETFQRPDLFSNQTGPVLHPEQWMLLIPENLDPPSHTRWRQLLSPFFSPKRIAEMDAGVRHRAAQLVESLVERGECDYVYDFSRVYPTRIFLDIMGIGSERLDEFMEWEDNILHTEQTAAGLEIQMAAMNSVIAMFSEEIAERRKRPGIGLVSEALTWRIDGEAIPDSDLLSMCLLMFMAGLDTVTNELAYSTWHLATHPDDRKRIVDDPSLIPGAIEEFLRYYPIVTPPRQVAADIDFHGCPMKKGDMVFLPLAVANRDPAEFPDAGRVIIDRPDNHHIGFGAGPHRCLGSHLARREMRAALEEWHARIPNYSLVPGIELSEYVGVQIGFPSLPITWK